MKQQYPIGDTNLGYTFTHEKHSIERGFPNLRVFLRQTPSGTHFDPESMSLTSVTDGKPNDVIIHHPTQLHGEMKVLAGRVVLTDRRQHKVEFFTFGGMLTVDQKSDYVECTLNSDAPIYLLDDRESASALFAEDAEIMLAERRAAFIPHEEEFDKRLIEIDPFHLFVAVLHEIAEKLEHLPYKRIKRLFKLHQYVTENLKLLADYEMEPEKTPTFEKLF